MNSTEAGIIMFAFLFVFVAVIVILLTLMYINNHSDDEKTSYHYQSTYNFDTEENAAVNRMWIEVRCYNIKNVPAYIWVVVVVAVIAAIAVLIRGKIVERSMKRK